MENNISITDFLQKYKQEFNPKSLTSKEFKEVSDVVYSRQLLEGSKYFLHFKSSILSLYDLENNSFPVSRFIRNEFQKIFKDHFILLENRIIEVLIKKSNTIQLTFQDIFNLNQTNPFDTSKIRFNVLQKLFRETKVSEFFYFNLPSIQFASLLLEKIQGYPEECFNKDFFLFNSPFPVSIK